MFLILSDSENTRDILLTAKDAGMFNGEYAIFTVDLLLKHDHDSETYEHGLRGDELSQQGKDLSFFGNSKNPNRTKAHQAILFGLIIKS